MHLIRGRLTLLQPLIDVFVAPPGSAAQSGEHLIGLLDTGCTRTCVTRSVAGRLGLLPVTKLLVASPTETQRRKAYEFQLGFYCERDSGPAWNAERTLFMLPKPVIGPDFVDNPNFDVLIGMDLISQGRLVFERGGDFTFTF
jgi:hypothetical protein